MVKLLFLDMDGAGANSWNDIEKYWNSMRRKGLSHKEISKAYDRGNFKTPQNCQSALASI